MGLSNGKPGFSSLHAIGDDSPDAIDSAGDVYGPEAPPGSTTDAKGNTTAPKVYRPTVRKPPAVKTKTEGTPSMQSSALEWAQDNWLILLGGGALVWFLFFRKGKR